ncbi:hypothetical protein [Bradyrhizobium sp. USDA 4353]
MDELFEPLARTAGIATVLAEVSRHHCSERFFIDQIFVEGLCNDKPQRQFATRSISGNDAQANDFATDGHPALELSGFFQDQTGTDQMITMRLGTRGLNQFV